ncbi:MAG: CbiX/SirB N-terminal domain-containing protein [Paracoccaceae bacterium]
MTRLFLPHPPAALIVAHGQPSDPLPAAAEIAFLAAKVQALMPGWRIRSATLAEEGALAREVAAAGRPGLIYPLFMAGGWFTATHLPARLAAAGGQGWRILPPFGLDPGVQALTLTMAREAAARRGHAPADLPLLLAAHGSFRSPAPAELAQAMVARLRAEAGFARAEAAFIDQSPRIAEVAAGFPPGALVLPFFAARGGHVTDDLPQALQAAGFSGQVLPPVGLDPRVPGLIRAALRGAMR